MKKNKEVLIVLLAVIAISLVACGKSAGILENTTWVLQSYGQPGNLKSVLKDTEISRKIIAFQRQ